MFDPSVESGPVDNRVAARALFGVAALLEAQGANPYRVRAYRRAAVGLLRLSIRASDEVNAAGELDLPGLGPRLRRKLGELLLRGRMQFADDLLAELPGPYRELLRVPGVGPRTARRLMRDLGIRGVPGLARAARLGRLQALPGIGPVREQRLREAAEALLGPAA